MLFNKDLQPFLDGTAIPRSHQDFIALANEAIQQMQVINEHLQQILQRGHEAMKNDTTGF